MKLHILVAATCASVFMSTGILAQSAEIIGDARSAPSAPAERGLQTWTGPNGVVLFDNGPFITDPGVGAGGADVSALQETTLGLSTLGFGHQIGEANLIADDFTVPPGATWPIQEIVFFAYQTNSPPTSTFSDYRVRIWDGPPAEAGSYIVWGDQSTNVLIDTLWTGIYRTTDTDLTNTQRPIMANTVQVNTTLEAGTYWIDWQAAGDVSFSGPWAPPVTILGQASTGDGLQSVDGGVSFTPVIDLASSTTQGFPFIVTRAAVIAPPVAVPAAGPFGLLLLVLLIAGLGTVMLRRI